MNTERIVILGGSGSGKSTLAMDLGEILGVVPTHIDRLHGRPGWQKADANERGHQILDVMRQDRWILDGTCRASAALEARIARADTIVPSDDTFTGGTGCGRTWARGSPNASIGSFCSGSGTTGSAPGGHSSSESGIFPSPDQRVFYLRSRGDREDLLRTAHHTVREGMRRAPRFGTRVPKQGARAVRCSVRWGRVWITSDSLAPTPRRGSWPRSLRRYDSQPLDHLLS